MTLTCIARTGPYPFEDGPICGRPFKGNSPSVYRNVGVGDPLCGTHLRHAYEWLPPSPGTMVSLTNLRVGHIVTDGGCPKMVIAIHYDKGRDIASDWPGRVVLASDLWNDRTAEIRHADRHSHFRLIEDLTQFLAMTDEIPKSD